MVVEACVASESAAFGPLWLVNRFADLFLVLPDGTVRMLDVGVGTLTQRANSRDDFAAKIGEYTVENAGPLPVWDYLGAYGSIHEQLRNVPDGAQVVLDVVNKQAEP